MKLADGLFLRCCREVAARYPEIEYKELIVDNASMQLVIRPETFDILLLPNLYGDIVSDLAAGLVGGLGVVPGANMGDKDAVFEAVHGSAPDIAGKGIANPTALMLSSVLMLIHLGELDAARRLRSAIERTYAEGRKTASRCRRQGHHERIHRRGDRESGLDLEGIKPVPSRNLHSWRSSPVEIRGSLCGDRIPGRNGNGPHSRDVGYRYHFVRGGIAAGIFVPRTNLGNGDASSNGALFASVSVLDISGAVSLGVQRRIQRSASSERGLGHMVSPWCRCARNGWSIWHGAFSAADATCRHSIPIRAMMEIWDVKILSLRSTRMRKSA